ERLPGPRRVAHGRGDRIDVAQSGYRRRDVAASCESDGANRLVSAVVPANAGIHPLVWSLAPFAELAPRDLHDALQLRSAVFVVEQTCVFLDIDGADPACSHLLGRNADGALVAYCRLVPPGVKYPEPSIGRVITSKEARRTGAGRELMREAVRRAEGLWPG